MTTPTNPVKVAGIAGGVGTTVLTTILGGVESDIRDADIVVARNDFRCAQALVSAMHDDSLASRAIIFLFVDDQRALDVSDFVDVLDHKWQVVDIPLDHAIARADDAGLLDLGAGAVRRLKDKLNKIQVSA